MVRCSVGVRAVSSSSIVSAIDAPHSGVDLDLCHCRTHGCSSLQTGKQRDQLRERPSRRRCGR